MRKNLVYAGLRIDGEHLLHCFMHGKKEMYWSKVRWVVIGHKYQTEEGGSQIKRTPVDLGEDETIPIEIIEMWKAKTVAAEEFRKRQSASRKSKKLDLWNKELWQIHSLYKKLSYREQDAFFDRIRILILGGNKE